MSEYKCKNCRYENFSIFEFPCDACYGGSWYEAAAERAAATQWKLSKWELDEVRRLSENDTEDTP